MENTTFKSLSAFIMQLVYQFEYSDFQPPITPATLKNKLAKLLSIENPFWSLLTPPQNWQEWDFIQLKSFKPWDPVHIGFLCQKRELTLIAFDELNGTRFHKEFMRHEIDLIETWLNHKHLFDGFSNVIIPTLYFANRSSNEQSFADATNALNNK